ncbi:hypothetical protein VL20_4818 [Microcystis panniformis FACHB-1757]|uniref:Uncharacterized protein n=1 Tax=Microcystis panniformis FACHB-1757 TaxID=1638788 RepID=A0A0K1S6R0_9CHRO|nr:hypothetical protein VL20_4818 [Microcystis panniformis FACHB-1757]
MTHDLFLTFTSSDKKSGCILPYSLIGGIFLDFSAIIVAHLLCCPIIDKD